MRCRRASRFSSTSGTLRPSQRSGCTRATMVCVSAVLVLLGAYVRSEEPEDDRIVARVNDRPIYAAEVEAQLADALGGRTVEGPVEQRLREEVTRQLADRQLVLQWLQAQQLAASQQDVELAIQRLTEQLASRGQTLPDYLARESIDARTLRSRFEWTLSWRRLLDRYLTDENLARYFDQHRRQFDGTKLRVAHILFAVPGAEAKPDAMAQAAAVREKIASGALTFAEAARQYSAAPTADQGGDLGWIGRHEPMPETFSAAAFQLEVGQTSEPVITDAGVHLIHCLETKPGQATWQDARAPLEAAVGRYLFRWAADKQRETARVELRIEPRGLPQGE